MGVSLVSGATDGAEEMLIRVRWIVAFVLLVLWPAVSHAQQTRLVIGTQAVTIPSDGGGTAAAATFTPLTSHVAITCNDPDTCEVTLGEVSLPGPTINGRVASMKVELVNVGTNAVTFADVPGVQELQSSVSLAQDASLSCTYETNHWACGGGGGGSGTVTTTGSPASGELAKFSGASSVTTANLTGDVTTSGTVATTIANDAVSNAKLRNSGALSVIGRSANSSGDPADISASAASDAVLRESGSTVGFGTITTGGIANDSVTYSKIQNVSAAGRVLCRGTAGGAGDMEECTLGAGMSQAGTVISSVVVGSNGGDVVGPSSSTDEAIARFDSTTGKLLQNTSTLTLSDAGAFTFADGVKQTFNPNGTNAGINVGSQAGDPGSPANGDLWYDSTANTLDARINGATVNLGSGSGKLAQEVNTQTGAVATGTTTIPMDDTIPQNTEGTEFMTLAITPTSSTNKLKIESVFNVGRSAAGHIVAALFQDTTADALAAVAVYAETGDGMRQLVVTHYMTAGTTSATTFKVRAGPTSAATITFNGTGAARRMGGVMASSITISEIVP